MKTAIVESCLSRAQTAMCDSFSLFADENECCGRALAIPLVLADTLVQVVKISLAIIEQIALSAINLFGAAFSEKCACSDGIDCLEEALHHVAEAIVLPFRFVFQIVATIRYPERAGSIHWCRNLGKPCYPVMKYFDFSKQKSQVLLTNGELLSWFGIATPQKV